MWLSHPPTTICAPSKIRVRVWSSLSLSSLSQRGNSHGAFGSFFSLIDADEFASFFIRKFFAAFVVGCFCQRREQMAAVADKYLLCLFGESVGASEAQEME
jgi:hypothetical protein